MLKFLAPILLLVTASANAWVTAWQDVEVRKGRVFIDVEIEGVPAKALLDSGSVSMVVNPEFLKENDIPFNKGRQYTVTGANGQSRAFEIKKLNVTIFGSEFPLKNVPTFTSSPHYQMIIGMPFLRIGVFQIDYPNKKVRAFSRENIDLASSTNVEMEFATEDFRLVTTVKFGDDDELDLLFDTGSTAGIVIDRYHAKRRGWLEKYRAGEIKLAGIGNVIDAELLQLPYLRFGPYELENVKVVVPKESNATTNYSKRRSASAVSRTLNEGSGYVGIMGGDVFKHFQVTLDAKNALMHIIVPQTEDSPD